MLAEFIKQYRKENNLTQKQLAVILGIDQQGVSRIEKGGINVGEENLLRYIDKLGYELVVKKKGE